MRRWLTALLLLAVSGLAIGCGGGDKDKGINKDKDRPVRRGNP
jgi:hypothetical protein